MTVATLGVLICLFAANDNDVEWNGVSHVATTDRRPICPVNGQGFQVRFQAYRFDLSAARVLVSDNGTQTYDAYYVEDRGPYAIWAADLPPTASTSFSYVIELTDGSDTDYYGPAGMSDDPPASGFEINYQTLSHAPLGATPAQGGGTVFRVWAPHATAAWVRGQFNGWGTGNPMTHDGEFFAVYVANANDRQQYKYYFNPGGIWKPDARAKSLNPGDNYNTYIENPLRYVWTSSTYNPPAFEDLIIYELHVGTFAGRNDSAASGAIPALYSDLAAHVDHLAELGVTAVELCPITEYPWDFSAGYNPVTAFAPEWKHGTPDDLKHAVDVLHANGIAVLLDICWNHFSGSDNYLWNYDGQQHYFDDPAVQTPWGAQADFDAPQVRSYFLDSMLQWIDEYHLDGFRMDATDFMNIYPQEASGWSLMQDFNNLLDNRAVDKVAIAEQLPNDTWVTRPTSLGGAGFDSQWNDYFTDTLRAEILDAGWDQNNVEMWKIADILDGNGQYLENVYVTNYLELHDECNPSTGGQRIVRTIDPSYPHDDVYARGRVKLGQGLVMFAPGIPMFLQGSEWLDDTPFGGGDPNPSVPAGTEFRINWALKTSNAPIFQYFRDIIATRKSNGALRGNAGIQVYHTNDADNVIAYQRWDLSGNVIVVVANFGNSDRYGYRLGFPANGTWYELINSQAAVYGGNNVGNGGSVVTNLGAYDGFAQSAEITIPQMGLLVLRYNDPPPNDCPADLNGDDVINLDDLSVLLVNFGIASGATPEQGDLTGDGAIDLDDLSQMLVVFGTTCA